MLIIGSQATIIGVSLYIFYDDFMTNEYYCSREIVLRVCLRFIKISIFDSEGDFG